MQLINQPTNVTVARLQNQAFYYLQEIRKLIISAIMATDMSFHFSLTTEFKNHAGWPLTQCSPMCAFNKFLSLFLHTYACFAVHSGVQKSIHAYVVVLDMNTPIRVWHCPIACALSGQNAMFSTEIGSLKFPVLCANSKWLSHACLSVRQEMTLSHGQCIALGQCTSLARDETG